MFLRFKEGPYKSVLDLAVQYCQTGHIYLLAEHGGIFLQLLSQSGVVRYCDRLGVPLHYCSSLAFGYSVVMKMISKHLPKFINDHFL